MMKGQAAEFFAGIGLVRMALERVGWAVTFANDIDPKKLEMYRSNFGDRDFLLEDIRRLTAEMIPNVALATASFPCIDLSLAGNRGGLGGAHSSAYWEFHRLIDAMRDRRPPKVLLENVTGLLSSNGGDDLRSIVVSLNKLGYTTDLLMVDAVHFGRVDLRYVHGNSMREFFERWLREYPDPYPQRYRKNIPFAWVKKNGVLLMALTDGEVTYPAIALETAELRAAERETQYKKGKLK